MPHAFDRLASEWLRTLRGFRSQPAFARRLGYKSNVVYAWESGRAYPTASATFRIAARNDVDVRAALERFYRGAPSFLAQHADPTTPAAVAALLDDLRGQASVVSVAQRAGLSRYRVARWLDAATEPRLPDFLRVVEAASLRVLDFMAAFTDPARLPSIAAAHRQLEAARAAAYEVPWSQAVLRALELADYRALAAHEPGWIAKRLGIALPEEERCLTLLVQSQQAREEAGKYVPTEVRTLDTRSDPNAARKLRAFWASEGAERLRAGASGTFAHNVFGVSSRDLEKIRTLQTAYYRELRAIVARSEPVEHVVLASLQLLPLG